MPMEPSNVCPCCERPVYPAEAQLAALAMFHKQCFKCTTCNKYLESTNVCETDRKLYCKNCYSKDSKAARAAVSLNPLDVRGATVENGCPRCSKRVYEAEKLMGAGKEWHKTCFRCKNCNKFLDSSTLATQKGELYCKTCHGRLFGITRKH